MQLYMYSSAKHLQSCHKHEDVKLAGLSVARPSSGALQNHYRLYALTSGRSSSNLPFLAKQHEHIIVRMLSDSRHICLSHRLELC